MDTSGDHVLTIEEASTLFDQIAVPYISVEEEFELDRPNIPKAIEDLKVIEKAVIYDNVFSENEEYDEISEEHIK